MAAREEKPRSVRGSLSQAECHIFDPIRDEITISLSSFAWNQNPFRGRVTVSSSVFAERRTPRSQGNHWSLCSGRAGSYGCSWEERGAFDGRAERTEQRSCIPLRNEEAFPLSCWCRGGMDPFRKPLAPPCSPVRMISGKYEATTASGSWQGMMDDSEWF